MIDTLDFLVRPLLGIAAVAYLGLAVRVTRSSPQQANSVIAFIFFLVGALVAGSAFSYGTTDPNIYGIGRILAFFASGFLPVAFYVIYREYTVGSPSAFFIALLSVVPIATTLLALTNSMHNIIWAVVETEAGIRFTDITEHYWFKRVHAPFMYGLIGFTIAALAARLPTIALAHRRTVLMLLGCTLLPFAVNVVNRVVGIGAPDFPFTSLTLVLLLPLFAYVSVSMRFYEFSPVGYQTLFNHVRDAIIVLDHDERIVCANKSAEELLGGTEKEMIGQSLWEDFPEAKAILKQANELDLTQTLKFNKDHIYELSVAPLKGPKGQNLGMVVACRNVTERRKAQHQLADSEHLIRTLIETSSNGILRFARDRSEKGLRFRCVFANRAAETYLGSGTGTLVGMPLHKLSQLDPERLITHFGNEAGEISTLSFETPSEQGDDESWLRIVCEPVGDDFSVTLVDITQRKRNEDKMLADALRDPLTNVLNRRGFEKEGAACVRANETGAVLYLDLNHFKTINDRFGHHAGDALLKAFGHRLEFCLRPEDILGRLGGDEFAIVLPDVSVTDAKHVAERVVKTASEAYIIQGQEIQCTASVGIALMPKHGEELWHLVSIADQAMYNAKSLSQNDDAANDPAAYIEAATAS
ncbi:MAG: diguanylate cyclase [Gammaproteobacteria bacterium]|nr:diguanylate cyclase [Gammaproteobacteria bacterium]